MMSLFASLSFFSPHFTVSPLSLSALFLIVVVLALGLSVACPSSTATIDHNSIPRCTPKAIPKSKHRTPDVPRVVYITKSFEAWFSHLKAAKTSWNSRSRRRDPRTTPSAVLTSTVRGCFLSHSMSEEPRGTTLPLTLFSLLCSWGWPSVRNS